MSIKIPPDVKRNVVTLYVLHFLVGFVIWYGIEKIFITQYLHLGPSAIAYIVIVYGVIQITLNIPTGALADRWSRKNMIISALVILLFSTYILGSSRSLVQYLIGTFGWGLYFVCETGTLESLMYDGLKQQGLDGSYKKVYGRSQAILMVGVFISSSVSGFITRQYGIRWTYYLTMVFVGLAITTALCLVEPVVHKKLTDTKVVAHMLEAIKMIPKSPVLLQIVLMSTVLFLIQTAYYEYAQLYYIAIFSASAIATGIANGSAGLSLAAGSLMSRYVRFTGGGYLTMAILLFASMLPLNSIARIILFILFGITFGIVNANVNNLKHSKIPSHIRATLSSAISTVDYIIVIPLALVFSHLIALYSIFWAYRVVALLALIYFVIYIVFGQKIFTSDSHSKFVEE